jgi:hypothetical protein
MKKPPRIQFKVGLFGHPFAVPSASNESLARRGPADALIAVVGLSGREHSGTFAIVLESISGK